MRNLERRLQDLEERVGGASGEHEEAARREILRRMTTPDLKRLETVLENAEEASPGQYRLGELTEEDRAMLERYEELCKQVRGEQEAAM